MVVDLETNWGMNILFIIALIIVFCGLSFCFVIMPIMMQSDVTDFCIKNNFSEGDYGHTIFKKSYCTIQEGNNLIKVEIESCKNELGWCFINKKLEEKTIK